METENIFVECMHCHRERVNGAWVENTIPPGSKVSHGLCDECDELYYSEAAIEAALKKENGNA
jgi:hypothetical protein